MKVKRFNNLWAMGLILFGAILVAFYVAKIFFPQFIVGVAEIPSIVKFGNYVDSNKWAKHLYNVVNAFACLYFYLGACCRTYKFSWKGFCIIALDIILLRLLSELGSKYYTTINYVFMILIPFLICVVENKLNKLTFTSTTICFAVDCLSQIMSLEIRDLIPFIHNINSATFFVLMIDVFILRIMLYLFYNYKKGV